MVKADRAQREFDESIRRAKEQAKYSRMDFATRLDLTLLSCCSCGRHSTAGRCKQCQDLLCRACLDKRNGLCLTCK